jgi:hypothetical protein
VGLAAVAALGRPVEVLAALQVDNARRRLAVAADRRQARRQRAGGAQKSAPTGAPGSGADTGDRPAHEQARRVVDLTQQEAGRFRHRYVGAEHVLLGMLRDDTGSAAAQVLWAWGMELGLARAELGRLAERGVVASPGLSDAELLGLLGVGLDAVRQRTEQTFGFLWGRRPGRRPARAAGGRAGGVDGAVRPPLLAKRTWVGEKVRKLSSCRLRHQWSFVLLSAGLGSQSWGEDRDLHVLGPWRQLHCHLGGGRRLRPASGSGPAARLALAAAGGRQQRQDG